jgi:hypothetical protein
MVEIYLAGLSTDLPAIYTMLKDLVESDKNQGIYLPLIASFLKQYGVDFVGVKGRTPSEDRTQELYYLGDMPILQAPQQEKFRNLLVSYFRSIEAYMMKEYQVSHLIGPRF